MSDKNSNQSPPEEQRIQLGTLALNDFNCRNYSGCLENLKKLEAVTGSSKKLLHNKAVVEFYKNDFKKFKLFHRQLNEVIGRALEDEEQVEIKDISLVVAYFNKAIMLFQLRQPQAALRISLALLKHVDVLEDALAQRVALLTINLLLTTNQVKKAEAVVELLQGQIAACPDAFASDEEDDNDSSAGKGAETKPFKSLDQFKWMFRLYMLRTKLLNDKTITVPNEETTEMLVLKAHQYYNGHDFQMAAKELTKKYVNPIPTAIKNGEDYNAVIANNMGLIHFHVRHYALAVRFFQHALTFDQDATESVGNESPAHVLGSTKRPEILYNLGIALLHVDRPKEAFECLLIPLSYYHNNPKLWLRLAEACIMVHTQSLRKKDSHNIVSLVIGSGLHRKYVVHPTPPKHVSEDGQSSAIPSTSLEFASYCLRNALTLIDYYINDINKGNVPTNPPNSPVWTQIFERSQCNPSRALTLDDLESLKHSILAAYSYVQICLGEYSVALKLAKELSEMPNLPDTFAMLARLYCAESLIMLDRINEARIHLEPKFIASLKEDDFIHRTSPDWKINSLNAAQSVLKYNLCVLLVMTGELEAARTMLPLCKHPIVITKLKMLKMFIEMQSGNIENCRIMVRIDTPQYS